MKFFVIVNRKYLVTVEANSHGGAEHCALDLIYGISTAQAFSENEIGFDCFRAYAAQCETLSLAELREMSENYGESVRREEYLKGRLETCAKRTAQLEKRISEIEATEREIFEELEKELEERTAIFG